MYLPIFLCVTLISLSSLFAGIVMKSAPPILMMSIISFSIGIFYVLKSKKPLQMLKNNSKILVLMALILLISHALEAISYQKFSPGLVSLIANFPFSIAFAAMMFNERLSLKEIIGLMVAFSGLILITTDISFGNPSLIFIPILGSMLIGFSTVLVRKYKNVKSKDLIAGMYLLSAPFLFLLSYYFEGSFVENFQLITPYIYLLMFIIIAITVFTKLLTFNLLQNYEIHKVIPFFLIIPVLTFLLDVLFFGFSVNMTEILGIFLTISGLLFAEFRFKGKFNKYYKDKILRHDKH